jgi:hypothetical protein
LPKVYCEYCYEYVSPVQGDGILECSNCGAGLAPDEEIEIHGSYKRFMECAEACFGVCHEYYEWKTSQGLKVNGREGYPKCPYEDKVKRRLNAL